MHSYTIYTIGTWSVLMVNSPTLIFIYSPYCYKLKILELIKRKNLVLRLTQENSIKNSVQNSLPYILNPHGLC